MPLDPEQLTPAASVNRVRIVDLPGLDLPDDVRGKTAFELCSQAAFVAQIRGRAAELGLQDTLEDADVPRALARCLASSEPVVRAAAGAVCAQYGRNLGFVIATLKRGDEANRLVRDEWDDSYWQHWASVRHLWLGGGLSSGALGSAFREQATRVLLEAGVTEYEIRLHEHPAALPLLGAACGVVTAEPAALVVDFGQTQVKSGIARYESGRLSRLEVLPILPSVVGAPDVAEAMASRLADLWLAQSQVNDSLARELAVCIASYVKDNHPYSYSSSRFADLHRLKHNLGDWLSGRISELAGRDIEVRLLHDGSAAGNAFAGQSNTAVLMLGTAMGVGFASLNRPAVALAPDFEIRETQG